MSRDFTGNGFLNRHGTSKFNADAQEFVPRTQQDSGNLHQNSGYTQNYGHDFANYFCNDRNINQPHVTYDLNYGNFNETNRESVGNNSCGLQNQANASVQVKYNNSNNLDYNGINSWKRLDKACNHNPDVEREAVGPDYHSSSNSNQGFISRRRQEGSRSDYFRERSGNAVETHSDSSHGRFTNNVPHYLFYGSSNDNFRDGSRLRPFNNRSKSNRNNVDNFSRNRIYSNYRPHNMIYHTKTVEDSSTPIDISESNDNEEISKNTKEDVTKFKEKRLPNQKSTDEIQRLDSTVTQKDHLTKQLEQGTLECLVCYQKIKQNHAIWSCIDCHHVLHLHCITRWAETCLIGNDDKWRCPACRKEYDKVPRLYMCFCGKNRLLREWNCVDVPHSCGEICGRTRIVDQWSTCEHKCNILCHPGPCPSCLIMITRKCGCGKTEQRVQCGISNPVCCDGICDKFLNCKIHKCIKICHFGPCDPCEATVDNACYCGKNTAKEVCLTSGQFLEPWSCKTKCHLRLNCMNHFCEKICHPEDCGPCLRMPNLVKTCPCESSNIDMKARKTCLDPIPTCQNICRKQLPCGTIMKPHSCEQKCHEGECQPCNKESPIRCECGLTSKMIPCVDLDSPTSYFNCEKKCTKKLICGKHKCNGICCTDSDHICTKRCTGMLSCRKHRCPQLCHRGKCNDCTEQTLDDISCYCGASTTLAPIPCGTPFPECTQPCSRAHDCDHYPLHTCHRGETCPPCTVFTDKWCYRGHELRRTIPCHQKEFSCGLPCGKSLPCGQHFCNKPCHKDGLCLESEEKCTQPCNKLRALCGHSCSAPCHSDSVCPDIPCRQPVPVSCECGNLVVNHPCSEQSSDYQRIVSSTLATKMAEVQLGHVVKIEDITEKSSLKNVYPTRLECNEECSIIMRNRRLAMCLQIQNPDLSLKLTPRYSDFLKQWAKKNPDFCKHVHDQLKSLVHLAKESKQRSRSFSFEVMNREKRQFVYEYSAHFGCETKAYDAEPKRNIVATAYKDKCWLPGYSLLEIVQREKGHRKVCGPVVNKNNINKDKVISSSDSNIMILPVLPSSSTVPDYFNDPAYSYNGS